jgi:hypothetical protein
MIRGMWLKFASFMNSNFSVARSVRDWPERRFRFAKSCEDETSVAAICRPRFETGGAQSMS